MSDNYTFPLPTLDHFVEFIFFDGPFLPHELQRIDAYWEASQSEAAVLEGGTLRDDSIRKSSVIGINYERNHHWIYDRLTQLAKGANQQHYHFDMVGFHEPLQLAEYGVGDFFDWHLDFGVGYSSRRKLSISVQLSDPNQYEGGNLEFQINNKVVKAPRAKGTVIIFPSFIMHRVTPITSGRRRSIVGWVSGQPFR
ncbi:MAG: 2OG-Fe(II) oxygenase [Bacteroidota bacterium]